MNKAFSKHALKTIKLLLAAEIAFVANSAYAQGTFQNLDFEQANPVLVSGPGHPYEATASSALPGWTVIIGGVVQNVVGDNGITTGASWVSLIGPGSQSGFSPIDGNYSVLLQGLGGAQGTPAITQTGTIPSGAQSLLFYGVPAGPRNPPIQLLVGDQAVPLVEIASDRSYNVYGGNISAWAGQTETITFAAPLTVPYEIGNFELDDISFSPNAIVPEPSPLALMGIGGFLFALYKRFGARRGV